MNTRNLFKLGSLLLVLMLTMSMIAVAQTQWYVDVTNGLTTNNGKAPNQPALGVGPVPSITYLLTLPSPPVSGDVINIAAGTYADAPTIAINVTINGYIPDGGSTVNVIMNGALTFSQTGTVTFTVAGVGLGGQNPATQFQLSNLNLVSGSIGLTTAQVAIQSGSTITRTTGTLLQAPTFSASGNYTLVYADPTSNGSLNAGFEVPASFGTGTITNNRTQFRPLNFPASVGTLTLRGPGGAGTAINNSTTGDMTFNSNITIIRNSSIQNASTGNLTINGNVNITPGVTFVPGFLISAGGGAFTVNGNVTVTANDVVAGSSLQNTSTGSLNINGNVSFVHGTDTSAPIQITATIINSGGTSGTLAINGQVTHTSWTSSGGTVYEMNVNMQNTSTGSMSVGSAAGTSELYLKTGVVPYIQNAAGGTFSLTGNLKLAGKLTGAMTGAGAAIVNAGTIALGSSTLEFGFDQNAFAVDIVNNTGSVTSTAVGTGALTFSVANTGGAAAIQLIGTGGIPNVNMNSSKNIAITALAGNKLNGNLIFSGSGTLTFGATTTVTGGVTLATGTLFVTTGTTLTVNGDFNETGGAFDGGGAGANTGSLTVKGNFLRTTGVYSPRQGTLTFANGANKVFSPGANLSLYNLTVAATSSASLTLGQSVIVTNNFNISSGSIDLSTFNVLMTTATGTLTNASGYTSSGGGAIIFNGTGGFITGAGTFSNIEVNVGTGNVVDVSNAVAPPSTVTVGISGVLTIRSGQLRYNTGVATDDRSIQLNNSIVRPTIRFNVDPAAGAAITNAGAGGAGTFTVAATQTYNILYFGDANYPVPGPEWIAAQLYNVTIQTGDGALVPSTRTVTIPAVPVTIKGAVSVALGQTLNLNVQTATLSGDVVHTITGTVSNGIMNITGNSVTVQGDDSVTPGANVIPSISINPATPATSNISINRIYSITGNFNMTAGNATITMGSATGSQTSYGQRTIAGTFSMNAGTLTLGSRIQVGTGGANSYTHNGGTINLATYRLQYAPAAGAAFTVSGTAAYSSTSVAGRIVIAGTNPTIQTEPNGTGGTVPVPNMEVAANAALAGNVEISNFFLHSAGTLNTANAAYALTISGSQFYAYPSGTSVLTGPGTVKLTATQTLGVDGAYSMTNLSVDPGASGTVTLQSIDATDYTTVKTTARSVAVTGVTNFISGAVALDRNDLLVGTTFTRTATTVTGLAGGLHATAANTDGVNRGEMVFNNTSITPGVGFMVPNMRISGGTAVINGNNDLTVTGFFQYGQGSLQTGFTTGGTANLDIADGGTVIVDGAGTLDQTPLYVGKVNLYYASTIAVTGKEITTNSNAINNVTMNTSVTMSGIVGTAGAVTLAANKGITVNGTFALVTGTFNLTANAGASVTMADGATIARCAGSNFDTDAGTGVNITNSALLRAGAIKLLYNSYQGQGSTTYSMTAVEFPSTATVSSLTIALGDAVNSTDLYVDMQFSRTVAALTMSTATSGSRFYVGTGGTARTLTVTGLATVTKGTMSTGLAGGTTAVSTVVLKGDLSYTGGSIGTVSANFIGLNLNFGGTANQNVTIPSTGVSVNNFTMNQTGTGSTVTVTGGPLTIGGTLSFVNGILVTGSYPVVLGGTVDRSGLTGLSHIYGTVRRTIATAAGRYEYPVGSMTKYRPATITFPATLAYAGIITVQHVDSTAGGTLGLPVPDPKTGIRIGGYPGYYWLVSSSISFGQSIPYDLELVGTNPFGRPFNRADDLRIIHRFDGSDTYNAWSLQGDGSNYSNILEVVPLTGDTVVTVRASGSSGGIVPQGSRYTIGIPTRPPSFSVAPATATGAEGTALPLTFTANPNDVGETITYSLVTPPAGAAINATTGAFTWTPTYAQAGNYTITVDAFDGEFHVQTATAVTIANVNRPPVFAPKTLSLTKTDKDTVKVTLAATDPDADVLTFSVGAITPAATNAPTVASGVMTWKPTFADAGKTFTITAIASDGVTTGQGPTPGTDTMTVTVVINRSRALGDADGNGSVQAADAAVVLQYVAGLVTVTDPASLWAMDASKNGTVSAYDASLILQAAAGLIPPLTGTISDAGLSKVTAMQATGILELAAPDVTTNPEVVKVGLKISNPANVYSVALTSKADFSLVTIDAVNATLPEGWDMKWNVVNGELRIAAAGTTPLASGDIASIMIHLKSKESRVSFSTDAMLNENFQSLGSVEVAAIPTVYALDQNYPNPFNPSTTIRYQIPTDASVNLIIYNVQGQKIRTLVSKEQKAGYYNVVWDGRNEAGQTVSTGLYLYRVQAGSFVATQKMLMLK